MKINRKSFLFSIILIFFLVFSLFFMLKMPSQNSIYDGGLSVYALSGSPQDIQNAVNQAYGAGGGTVYIPEGDFVFNPPIVAEGKGVIVPIGVNIIGAGIGRTILRATIDISADYGFKTYMLYLQWSADKSKPNRISGITFQGMVGSQGEVGGGSVGIFAEGRQDFRIDHCELKDFTDQCVYARNSRGLIDHCTFDQPYKDRFPPKSNPNGQPWALWGYGVIVVGEQGAWEDITTLVGRYETVALNSVSKPVFVEDCDFTRCRHAIAGATNAFYVSRYNHFQKASPYDQVDGHGGSPGTRLIEAYNNVFDFTDESYSKGQDGAVILRGGAGIMFGNTIKVNLSSTSCLELSNDGQNVPYRVDEVYAWDNIALDVNGNQIPFRLQNNFPSFIQENINYFLREPNQAQDGFTYTPYQYPHPLTVGQDLPDPTPTPSQTPVPTQNGPYSPSPSESEPLATPTPFVPSKPIPASLEPSGNWLLDRWNDFVFFIRYKIFGWII